MKKSSLRVTLGSIIRDRHEERVAAGTAGKYDDPLGILPPFRGELITKTDAARRIESTAKSMLLPECMGAFRGADIAGIISEALPTVKDIDDVATLSALRESLLT